MDISVSIKEVHQVAVDHGWWDNDRDPRETVALMHSELSEALEEARAGRPMVWYECGLAGRQICDYCNTDCGYKGHERCDNLHKLSKKPEGVAVELIDCVIRIMDFMGRYNLEYMAKSKRLPYNCEGDTASVFILKMHVLLDTLFDTEGRDRAPINPFTGEITQDAKGALEFIFSMIIDAIFLWVGTHGADPRTVFVEKAEYNKSRPYRHGKKF